MTSLLTFLLTLHIVKKILIPVYGAELNSAINHAEPISMVDTASCNSFSSPQVIITDPLSESVHLDISLHDSMITVSIKSLICYGIDISAYFEDTFEVTKTFYKKEFDKDICNKQNGEINQEIFFNIPDSLAYFDEQNLDNPTNFYVNTVEVYVSFLLHNGELHYDKLDVLPLLSPWFRKPRPRYSRTWELHLRNLLKWIYIPMSALTYSKFTFLFHKFVSFLCKLTENLLLVGRVAWPPDWPLQDNFLFYNFYTLFNPLVNFNIFKDKFQKAVYFKT